MSKGYWVTWPETLLDVIKEMGYDPHISSEFIRALLEDDDKRAPDTTIQDELREYDRE